MTLPDWIFIGLFALSSACDIGRANGWQEIPITPTQAAFRVFVRPALFLGLAYWGGMFTSTL